MAIKIDGDQCRLRARGYQGKRGGGDSRRTAYQVTKVSESHGCFLDSRC
jgi:hypothetical protein